MQVQYVSKYDALAEASFSRFISLVCVFKAVLKEIIVCQTVYTVSFALLTISIKTKCFVPVFLVRKLRGDFDLGFELLLFCSIRFVQKVVYLCIVRIKDNKCSFILLCVSVYMNRR